MNGDRQAEQVFSCGQCLDDPHGWMVLRCPDEHCGRVHEMAQAHDYSVRCPHWLRLNADAIRATAQKALQDGKRPSSTAYALQDLDAGIYRYARSKTERARWAEQHEIERRQHWNGAA